MAAPTTNVLEFDRWRSEVLDCRKNPVAFFTTRQVEAGEFVLDILQGLYSDNLGDSMRVLLLSTLQERAAYLLTTPECIEQTIGSLTSMYNQTSCETSAFYKSQLLVAMTTILLESEQLTAQPRLFTDFVDLLLSTVSKVNSPCDRSLRGTACQCLTEIETMHPGVLMRKLEHISAMSQLEYTHVCQNYMLLFVQVLKNSIAVLLRNVGSIDCNEVTDLLCSRKEPLKPLSLPEDFNSKMFQLSSTKGQRLSHLPDDIDCRELHRCLSFLVDHLHLMSTPCAVNTLLIVTECMSMAPQVPTTMLKSLVNRMECSLDVALFNALMVLKFKFGSRLMTDAQEEVLLDRLVSCTSHPSLSPGQRLLCYHWLLDFPENKLADSTVDSHLPCGLDYSKFANLYPAVFDGLDTMLVKLNLLSLCFTPSHTQDSASATLMGCLVPLQKSIHYGITGRPAVTLYRALYLYYLRHHHTVLRQDIYKLIVTIVTEQPRFVPHTINFIECINRISTSDNFPADLLHSSMENIVSIPPRDLLEDLKFHLQLLEKVCQEQTISPKPIVAFLHQLLSATATGTDGSWLLGNCILSVCHSIMQVHDTADIFKELGQLLFDISTTFNDLDIRDRARFYYAMLTNISSEKISSILFSAGTPQSLTRLVTGSTTFDIPSPVHKLDKSILSLTRIRRRPVQMTFPAGNHEQYQQQLNENYRAPVIHVDYHLHYEKNADIPKTMATLYSLLLHVDVPRHYQHIPDSSLPCLSMEESSQPSDTCQVVSFRIEPLEPVSCELTVSSVFMTADGKPCSCHLAPVTVTFPDLFLPLPVNSANRSQIFTQLWSYIHKEQENPKSLCAESICSLLMNQSAIVAVTRDRLQEYQINLPDAEDTSDQFGIFLPPSWHILLKMTSIQDMVTVAIATDNWRVMPLVNVYLHCLEDAGCTGSTSK